MCSAPLPFSQGRRAFGMSDFGRMADMARTVIHFAFRPTLDLPSADPRRRYLVPKKTLTLLCGRCVSGAALHVTEGSLDRPVAPASEKSSGLRYNANCRSCVLLTQLHSGDGNMHY